MSEVIMVELPGCSSLVAYDSSKQLRGNPESILAAVDKYGLCIDAGRYGSIEVWRDDEKNYRCRFTCHSVIDEESVHSGDLDAAKAWLEIWWDKQHE